MKAIFCKECKWNKNGWCCKYECNGQKRTEVCSKYQDDDKPTELIDILKAQASDMEERLERMVNDTSKDNYAYTIEAALELIAQLKIIIKEIEK